ncbi:MAG: phosphoenolpyruvate synthase, partial [Lachnospiraceae bacterium]|nr:phosphoenolpyruvate synthase [Lachnospiraceae bacterium]
FYYIIRIYTVELGKHLVQKGVLNEVEDIWFTRVSALWDYLDGKMSAEDLRQMVTSKREYYNAFRNYMSENEIGGVFGEATAEIKISDGQIKGLGANSGRITGTARVIEDFSQIGRLQENDILVTRFTDTGWTPKFAILSGIVTEYGGILCHAAIVSREYGIPAIVSCHDAMKKIKDGDTITIDGSTGVVTVEQ